MTQSERKRLETALRGLARYRIAWSRLSHGYHFQGDPEGSVVAWRDILPIIAMIRESRVSRYKKKRYQDWRKQGKCGRCGQPTQDATGRIFSECPRHRQLSVQRTLRGRTKKKTLSPAKDERVEYEFDYAKAKPNRFVRNT